MYYTESELETMQENRDYKYSWETKPDNTPTPDLWETYQKKGVCKVLGLSRSQYMHEIKNKRNN